MAGAATKRYVDGKFFLQSAGRLTGILDMGHNRITNLPKATDSEDATSVTWVKENTLTSTQVETKINQLMPKNTITDRDARYVKKDGSFMSGPLAMSGHEITGLKDPTEPTDSTNKQWVEAQIPKGLWGLVAYVRGSPNSHTVRV